jgi:hypothetical protein
MLEVSHITVVRSMSKGLIMPVKKAKQKYDNWRDGKNEGKTAYSIPAVEKAVKQKKKTIKEIGK